MSYTVCQLYKVTADCLGVFNIVYMYTITIRISNVQTVFKWTRMAFKQETEMPLVPENMFRTI